MQEREGEAPSWYNAVEAGVVVDLVSSLLKQGLANGAGVRPADVGVIATFRRQVGSSVGHKHAVGKVLELLMLPLCRCVPQPLTRVSILPVMPQLLCMA